MEQRVVSQLNEISKQVGTVAEDVSEIKRDNELLRQSLLGGVEGETPHGRIPKIETDVLHERNERLKLEARVVKVETDHVRWKAYAMVVGILAGSVSSLLTGGVLILLKFALEGVRR